MQETELIRENLKCIQEKIANAAIRSGRSPEDVVLVAVTKSVNENIMELLLNQGVVHIGENRVYDAAKKHALLTHFKEINWHMIGHLQRNKVKKALQIFSYFHSVDSVRVAEEINDKTHKRIPILLQVNISGETAKYGFSPDELEQFLPQLVAQKNLHIQGLMTMAPFTKDKNICRMCFRKLNDLSISLREKGYKGLTELSMGMSGDFEIAIEEGSTIVRVGSALFQGVN